MALSTGYRTKTRICAAALLLCSEVPHAARADTQIGSAAQVVNSVTGILASTRQPEILRAGIDQKRA